MYPYIHIVLPSYSVMAALGGFLAACFIFFRLEKYKVNFSTFITLFGLCAIGGLIGSKLLYAITRIPWLIQNFSAKNLLLLIPESGYVFYGGLFGVIAVIILYTRHDKQERENIFALCVPAMPLFHAFGRIGCYMAGCCYGISFSEPLIIGSIWVEQVPVQLMEAMAEFILFGVLLLLGKKKDGNEQLKIYLGVYACIRFMDEFLRGDEIRGHLGVLSTAQWISLGILFWLVLNHLGKRKKKTA